MKVKEVDAKVRKHEDLDTKIFTIEDETLEDFSFTLSEDKNVKYPIFVYGTLKKGFFNYKRLLKDEQFVGTCFTKRKMFDFWSMQGVYPAVVPVKRNAHRVGGELFLVGEDKLANLDLMEFNYQRVCIPITMRDTTKAKQFKWAWLYLLSNENTDSQLWHQDDDQIKLVDRKKHIKIWGGEWAKESMF